MSVFGRKKTAHPVASPAVAARPTKPSAEVLMNRANQLRIKLTGVTLSTYRNEADFASLNDLTKDIVVEALKLGTGGVYVTVIDNEINVLSDLGTASFAGTVYRLAGIDPASVSERRGHYAPSRYGFNPRSRV